MTLLNLGTSRPEGIEVPREMRATKAVGEATSKSEKRVLKRSSLVENMDLLPRFSFLPQLGLVTVNVIDTAGSERPPQRKQKHCCVLCCHPFAAVISNQNMCCFLPAPRTPPWGQVHGEALRLWERRCVSQDTQKGLLWFPSDWKEECTLRTHSAVVLVRLTRTSSLDGRCLIGAALKGQAQLEIADQSGRGGV